MTQHDPIILTERRGGVLILTLNRPERLNAWSDALEERYYTLLAEAEADPAVRAVVLTGAGRGFCAGADMDDLRGVEFADPVTIVSRNPPRQHPMSFQKPLVAAINGAAAGLGLVEALYCDVRFATPAAKLTAAFTKRGLIAEHGVAWLLTRLVGRSRTFDILASSRVILGEEAHRMGLVDHLAPADELVSAAVTYAQELANVCSPSAMRIVKRQIFDAEHSGFEASVDEANRQMLVSFTRPDFDEGVRSYLERRPPVFEGLDLSNS